MDTEREEIVMDCIRMMYSTVDTDTAIYNTLEKLGNYYRAERAYVFRVRLKYMDNTHEWCAEGILPEKDFLQNVPIEVIKRWIPSFKDSECVVIRDLESIKEYAPKEYEVLKPQGIRTLIVFPLQEKGRLSGYFGLDNPDMDRMNEISDTFKILAYFFESLLERKEREDYLKKIGFTDGLTGAFNRNAFIRDTMPGYNREIVSMGVFFIDINGLKKTNDTYGHEAGDDLIRGVHQIVRNVMKKHSVYRLGGDEFVALCRDVSREELKEMEKTLREKLDGRHGCSAAVGSSFSMDPENLGELVDMADRKMYFDKKQYYQMCGGQSEVMDNSFEEEGN